MWAMTPTLRILEAEVSAGPAAAGSLITCASKNQKKQSQAITYQR